MFSHLLYIIKHLFTKQPLQFKNKKKLHWKMNQISVQNQPKEFRGKVSEVHLIKRLLEGRHWQINFLSLWNYALICKFKAAASDCRI